jgi:SAM-dependent methyltransferase/uncharacterized protein YbaR (Trm112 family)
VLKSTVEHLECPKRKKGRACAGRLTVRGEAKAAEILSGDLLCSTCGSVYPILAGVAIVVQDVRSYLLEHVKGVSKAVVDSAIPREFREEFIGHRESIEDEHIEEDLESDRVNSLYLMNHYLRYGDGSKGWWKSVPASESPFVTEWIRRYWDHGPFERVVDLLGESRSILELGCGVGGLAYRLPVRHGFYLGVDSSFQSVLLARHLNLGAPIRGELRFPGDLLRGSLSESFRDVLDPRISGVPCDFIVGEIDSLPVKSGQFGACVSMNAIDMLEEPKHLPEAQFRMLKPGGLAIQTGPYVWHERIARGLRARMPKGTGDSAALVEWLYRVTGFKIEQSEPHVPWLFFKHLRQIELYSVHVLGARKPA